MSGANLKGAAGKVTMTVQVTRAATGKVEEYQLTGYVTQDQADALEAEGFIQPQQEQEPSNG